MGSRSQDSMGHRPKPTSYSCCFNSLQNIPGMVHLRTHLHTTRTHACVFFFLRACAKESAHIYTPAHARETYLRLELHGADVENKYSMRRSCWQKSIPVAASINAILPSTLEIRPEVAKAMQTCCGCFFQFCKVRLGPLQLFLERGSAWWQQSHESGSQPACICQDIVRHRFTIGCQSSCQVNAR